MKAWVRANWRTASVDEYAAKARAVDALLASKDAEIARLREMLGEVRQMADDAQTERDKAHAERDALHVAVKAAEKMCMRSVERTVLPSPDEVLRLLSSCSAALAVVQPSG